MRLVVVDLQRPLLGGAEDRNSTHTPNCLMHGCSGPSSEGPRIATHRPARRTSRPAAAAPPRRGRGSQRCSTCLSTCFPLQRPLLGGAEDRNHAPASRIAPTELQRPLLGGAEDRNRSGRARRHRVGGSGPSSEGPRIATLNTASSSTGDPAAAPPRRGRGSQPPPRAQWGHRRNAAAPPRRGRGSQPVA